MSACDHWDGFSHCTECCDNQTSAAYRLIGEQKAELATTRQMLRDTAQSLQDEENVNAQLVDVLKRAIEIGYELHSIIPYGGLSYQGHGDLCDKATAFKDELAAIVEAQKK